MFQSSEEVWHDIGGRGLSCIVLYGFCDFQNFTENFKKIRPRIELSPIQSTKKKYTCGKTIKKDFFLMVHELN